MELIPAIDLRDGRCVRLFQGDFDAETVYADDPSLVLDRYRSFGARRVHLVDLDGARDGSQPNREIILSFARDRSIRFQVGGGLRTLARVRDLLASGIERAVIGSVAATSPDEVATWMQEIDPTRLVFAFDIRLDANATPFLTTHGWQRTSDVTLWSAVERYAALGLTHVLCTDVSRDGALTGPNLDLYADAVQRFPAVAWQASGGVSNAADLAALRDCGVAAVISGRALLENRISPAELQPFLPNASSPASM
jgi:phosphoribosylformimino-5-aminoimidazole carboxamide ribotide isomerase